MRLKIGAAFYWPPAGQRVVVCSTFRSEHTLITDKPLEQYLRESSGSWYPDADTQVLYKHHDEFAAGTVITEVIEAIEVQGVDWVTSFRTIFTRWEIRKEADVGSGDEGSGIEAAGAAVESVEPQHGSEPRTRT